MYPSEDTSKEIEDNEYSDVYITSPITLNNNYINANELISSSKYYDSFELKFNGLSNSFNLINPKEIYDFILLYDDLFDYLDEIEILLQKYFKNKDYCLEFSLDPEFQSLNQLVIYILIDQTSFDENWGLLRKLNKEIRNINGFPSNLKRLLSVDLG